MAVDNPHAAVDEVCLQRRQSVLILLWLTVTHVAVTVGPVPVDYNMVGTHRKTGTC